MLETDERDWQRVLDFLTASTLRLDFLIDGVAAELPDSAAAIFAIWQRAAPALHVDLAGIRLGCYFFVPSAIEFDFDPREVTIDDHAARLLAFMRSLADVVGKPVILTHEGDVQDAIVRFDPLLQEAG